jgi:acylphosphatase
MNLEAKNIIFKGRVQGVGFRFTAMNIANRCQLAGFVRNIPNGSVEMTIQGHPFDIKDCIRDIKETYEASISDVEIKDITPDGSLTDFKIAF